MLTITHTIKYKVITTLLLFGKISYNLIKKRFYNIVHNLEQYKYTGNDVDGEKRVNRTNTCRLIYKFFYLFLLELSNFLMSTV